MTNIVNNNERIIAAQNAHQKYMDEFFGHFSTHSEKIKNRQFEFFKKSEISEFAIKKISCGIVSGAAVGAAGGMVVGGCCGGPPGLGIGAVIGSMIGGNLLGSVQSVHAAYKLSPKYHKWVKEQVGRELGSQITGLLREEQTLTHLRCPITQIPVIDAVRTPDGQIYEKHVIIDWINKHHTNPITNKSLYVEDLMEDMNVSVESARATINVLQANRDAYIEKWPEIQEGYDSLLEDYQEGIMEVYTIKLNHIRNKWRNREITYEQYTEELMQLTINFI